MLTPELNRLLQSKEYQKLIHLAQKAERCTTREKAQKILLKVKKARKKLQKRAESHDERNRAEGKGL